MSGGLGGVVRIEMIVFFYFRRVGAPRVCPYRDPRSGGHNRRRRRVVFGQLRNPCEVLRTSFKTFYSKRPPAFFESRESKTHPDPTRFGEPWAKDRRRVRPPPGPPRCRVLCETLLLI